MFAPAQSRDLAQRIQLLAEAGSPYEWAVRQVVGRENGQPESAVENLPQWAVGLLGMSIAPEPPGLTAAMANMRRTLLRSVISRASRQLAFAYNPGQARVPKGNNNGGEWLDMVGPIADDLAPFGGGGTGPGSIASKRKTPINATSLGESVQIQPGSEELDALRKSSFSSQYIDEEGNWTPERAAWHEQVINEYLECIMPPDGEATLYMNGGGPASGKGGFSNGKIDTGYPPTRSVSDKDGSWVQPNGTPGAVLIDPDGVKFQMPEVKAAREQQNMLRNSEGNIPTPGDVPKSWAGESHEESSYLAKRIYQAALDRGLNVVYDGTGDGSASSQMKKLMQAKDQGYRLEGNYMYLEPKTGMDRAISRGARTGRFVDPSVQAKTYRLLPDIYNDAVSKGVYDKISVYDNNADNNPTLIAQGAGSKVQVMNQGAYDRWQTSDDRLPTPEEMEAAFRPAG